MKHDLTISMKKQIAKIVAFLAASSFCVLSPTGLRGEDIPVPPAVVKTALGTDKTNHTDTRQRVTLHPSTGESTTVSNLLEKVATEIMTGKSDLAIAALQKEQVSEAELKTARDTVVARHNEHVAGTQKGDQRSVVVSIARAGGLTVAGKRCKGSQLVAKLKELASKEPTTVTIRADKDAPFRSVTAVMDACKEAGVRVAEKVKTP
jgi:biopolymer transport protein ExbD